MHAWCQQRLEEGTRSLGPGVTNDFEATNDCSKSNTCPPGEHPMLITIKESLQCHMDLFLSTKNKFSFCYILYSMYLFHMMDNSMDQKDLFTTSTIMARYSK